MGIADASILDPPTSISGFIEILNHYLYYFDKEPSIFDSSVQKYITNLVEMIKGRLDELGGGAAAAVTQIGGISGVCDPDPNVDEWVKEFLRELCKVLEQGNYNSVVRLYNLRLWYPVPFSFFSPMKSYSSYSIYPRSYASLKSCEMVLCYGVVGHTFPMPSSRARSCQYSYALQIPMKWVTAAASTNPWKI
jgi:hypothetical protein